MENLKTGVLEYETVEEFLTDLKKEFGEGEEKTVKVAELRRLEQGEKIIEEFVQEFRRVARGSRYKRKPLIDKFKRGINGTICQRLIESEWQPKFIEQWYERAINLNRN